MNNILVYTQNISLEDSFHPERSLFEVDQKMVPLSECVNVLQTLVPSFNRLDDTMHLCAAGLKEQSGPTYGDFGGPLICGDFQVGVASMSIYNPNVSRYLYTIYTRIAPYHIWIDNILKQYSGTKPKPTEPGAFLPMDNTLQYERGEIPVLGGNEERVGRDEEVKMKLRSDPEQVPDNRDYQPRLRGGIEPYKPIGDVDPKNSMDNAQQKVDLLTGNFATKIKINFYLFIFIFNKNIFY